MIGKALATLALLAAVPLAAQEIPLINPGFEEPNENDPTMPKGWERWQAGPEQIHLDTTDPFEGQQCVAVGTNLPGRGTVVLRQFFSDYQPGQTYEVVFAARTNGVTGGRLRVINRSAIERHEGRAQIYPGETVSFENTTWRQLATRFTAPARAGDRLYLELSHVDTEAQGAIVWWDDFSIRPLLPVHEELVAATKQHDQELFAAMVHTRYAVGSRCDMLGWFLDDAIAAGALKPNDELATIRAQTQAIFDAMERTIAEWQQRHEEVFGATIALTRLSDDEIAARRDELERTAREGIQALQDAQAEWEERLTALEERAHDLAGEFEMPPALSADVRPETLGDRFHRIISWHGFMDDVDYVQRAMWSLGTTLVQAYLWREERRPLREQFLRHNQPRTLATVGAVAREGWPDLSGVRDAIARDFEELGDLPGYVGIEIDEPTIEEKYVTTPEVLEEFRAFVRARYDAARLRELGIADIIDEWTPPATIDTDPDRVLWMELQQFRCRMLADRLSEVQSYLQSLDERLVLLPVVQQFIPSQPQRASWVATGPVLDWIAMDPYNGGSPAEALEMDLLRSAARGPALLVVGTCYDPTADRFHKDMCISLAHADGLWLWCWVYMAKYRAPGYLRDWEPAYRHLWKPGMWEAAQEVFADIAAAEPYLTHTESAAKVALIYSERTGILASRERIDAFAKAMGLYQALMQLHTAQEAVFAETMTAENLAEREVVLLPDSRCMTDEELSLIRDWVAQGGTLVAFGATSLLDEWGRQRDDYALADVFGVRHEGELADVESLTPTDGLRALAPELPETIAIWKAPADLVAPTTAQVLATLPDGHPAITHNAFGEGTCYLITPRGFPLSFDGSKSVKGIYKYYWAGIKEVLDALIRSGLADERQVVEVSGAPDDVELTLRRKGDRLIAHLLNYSDEGGVSGVTLHVRGRPKRIFDAAEPDTVLSVRPDGDGVAVEIGTFDHHVMLVIE